ncbi:hypothetical protein EJB05_57039, partial [Eragrostis curvula]
MFILPLHCDGLIMIPCTTGRIFMCNPAIRELAKLPRGSRSVLGDHRHHTAAFGFDPSSGKYKVARHFLRSYSETPREDGEGMVMQYSTGHEVLTLGDGEEAWNWKVTMDHYLRNECPSPTWYIYSKLVPKLLLLPFRSAAIGRRNTTHRHTHTAATPAAMSYYVLACTWSGRRSTHGGSRPWQEAAAAGSGNGGWQPQQTVTVGQNTGTTVGKGQNATATVGMGQNATASVAWRRGRTRRRRWMTDAADSDGGVGGARAELTDGRSRRPPRKSPAASRRIAKGRAALGGRDLESGKEHGPGEAAAAAAGGGGRQPRQPAAGN